eukprot:scaffold54485_cov15-Prasinocladus_malaysianus.AAC.1
MSLGELALIRGELKEAERRLTKGIKLCEVRPARHQAQAVNRLVVIIIHELLGQSLRRISQEEPKKQKNWLIALCTELSHKGHIILDGLCVIDLPAIACITSSASICSKHSEPNM